MNLEEMTAYELFEECKQYYEALKTEDITKPLTYWDEIRKHNYKQLCFLCYAATVFLEQYTKDGSNESEDA